MRTVDNIEFERRGGRGCSNSAYFRCTTSCCENWCAWDSELDDLYLDGGDLRRVRSLLRSTSDPNIVCPFCGASDWDALPIDERKGIPQPWAWAVPQL